MRHPTDGTLRRLIDEPAAIADGDRDHVAECAACQATLRATSVDATLASRLFDSVDTPVDIDAAWSRLTQHLTGDAPTHVPRPARSVRRWRTLLRKPAVAATGVAVLFAGAGVAAATDWLPIFRTERIEPIVLDQRALLQLPDLSDYGELEIVDEVELRRVADAAEAAAATGLDAPALAELPRGVIGEPEYRVGDEATAVFTFSAEQASATAQAGGHTLPPAPPGMDGSQFRLVAGPGIAAVWREARGVPALLVGRANAPTGYSTGIPFDTARDYLLELPGLPDEVATQLRGFSADGSTLPLPIGDPDGSVSTSEVDVNGRPATVVEVQGGALAAVVWVDDGVVNAVAGLLDVDDVLAVARGLQ